jgi:hypothetical protein
MRQELLLNSKNDPYHTDVSTQIKLEIKYKNNLFFYDLKCVLA